MPEFTTDEEIEQYLQLKKDILFHIDSQMAKGVTESQIKVACVLNLGDIPDFIMNHLEKKHTNTIIQDTGKSLVYITENNINGEKSFEEHIYDHR